LNLDAKSLVYAPCTLVIVDRDLNPLSGSRKGFSVFGVRLRRGLPDEALQDLNRAMRQEAGFVKAAAQAVAQAQRPGSETQFRWERGGRAYEVTMGMLNRGEKGAYLLLFDDVTQQMQFEETRDLARRYLEDILNNIQLGVVVLNREMRITTMNQAQETFLHRLGIWMNWVEAIGMPVSELVPQDVKSLWAEITERVLGQGETYKAPRRIYDTPEGDLTLSVEVTPLKDQHGTVIGAIQVAEDVTERVRLEEELREAEIVAERLEAVRQTAITVNHEVNNPLMTILATTQVLLLYQENLDGRTRERLKVIEREVKRIAEVTRRLQTLDALKTDDYVADGPKMIDLGMDEEG